PPTPAAESVPQEAPAAGNVTDDIAKLAESDPMAFLNALAARQGANPNEIVGGMMEVPDVDPDSVVIDEPGYVPSEQLSFGRQKETTPEPSSQAAEPVQEAEEVDFVEQFGAEFASELEGATYSDRELEAEADPMEWLQSLTGDQQEVDLFDFEAADLQELDPAQTDFPIEAQDTRAVEAIIESGGTTDMDFGDIDLEEDTDALAWLTDLASGQGDDVSEFLSDLTDEAAAELPGFELDFESVEESLPFEESLDLEQVEIDPIIANATDEEIAQMQRDGTITPEQELQWLTLKAQRMSSLLQEDEPPVSEVGEVVPADLPDWIREQMPESLDEIDETPPAFIDSITPPPEPEDLPDWLSSEITDEEDSLELEIPELTLEDTLPQEPIASGAPPVEPVLTEQVLSEYDPQADPWAAAFDPEASVDDPDWYEQAVAKVEAEMMQEGFQEILEPASEASSEEVAVDWMSESVETEEAEGLPDWLTANVEGDPTISEWLRGIQTGGDDDVPAWTQEPVEVADEDIDLSWLSAEIEEPPVTIEDTPSVPTPAVTPEVSAPQPPVTEPAETPAASLPQGVEGALPSWYLAATGQVATPQPAVAVQQPQAQPIRQTAPAPSSQTEVRAVPATELQALYQKVENNPDDYDARLQLARGLQGSGNVKDSLNQYEVLINQFVMLDVVAEDLQSVVQRVPNHPKARRLLGDVYMRQGRLQEALDTYRGALSNI
ncbi:MAG: hypothetical protein CUN55_09275, partial [Phototrophicales bacterium]